MKKLLNINILPKKLSHKFIFMVAIVLFLTMGFAHYLNHQGQVKNFRAQLEIRGKSLGNFTALTISDAVLGQDYLLMNRYMQEISNQPDLVYGVILSAKGDNLTSYLNHDNSIVSSSYDEDFMTTLKDIDSHPDVFTMRFPIGEDKEIGSIILGLTTKNIDQLSQHSLHQKIIEIYSLLHSLVLVFLYYLTLAC